jgi:hypothetical protein
MRRSYWRYGSVRNTEAIKKELAGGCRGLAEQVKKKWEI